VPACAIAATIDASLIPDGTYVVKVERVVDAGHAVVLMQNGVETTLVARSSSVDFSHVKPNDTIKCAIIKGQVPAYAVQ
jgi:hypothetical protein